tara:strand:+ start:10614 stop:10832 length:219 start_codon:yes stop_codon:yes gene_type:complete
MTKKMKCPKCETEDEGDFTVWKRGSAGFTVYFDGTNINADDERWTDLCFDAISCQCGYESQREADFLVEVRE